MKQSVKLFLLRGLISGLFFGLLYWAWDSTEGISFDLNRFLLRAIVYGTGMAFIWWLTDKYWDKKKVEEPKS